MPGSQLMEAPLASDGALCRGQRAAVADSGRDALARLASVEGRSGVRWRNWARSQECRPERVFYPRTLEDVRAIVRRVGVPDDIRPGGGDDDRHAHRAARAAGSSACSTPARPASSWPACSWASAASKAAFSQGRC